MEVKKEFKNSFTNVKSHQKRRKGKKKSRFNNNKQKDHWNLSFCIDDFESCAEGSALILEAYVHPKANNDNVWVSKGFDVGKKDIETALKIVRQHAKHVRRVEICLRQNKPEVYEVSTTFKSEYWAEHENSAVYKALDKRKICIQ